MIDHKQMHRNANAGTMSLPIVPAFALFFMQLPLHWIAMAGAHRHLNAQVLSNVQKITSAIIGVSHAVCCTKKYQ